MISCDQRKIDASTRKRTQNHLHGQPLETKNATTKHFCSTITSCVSDNDNSDNHEHNNDDYHQHHHDNNCDNDYDNDYDNNHDDNENYVDNNVDNYN